MQQLKIDAHPPSLNQMYAGKLRDRLARKKGWQNAVAWAVREQPLRPVQGYPVTIHLEACFGPGVRRMDADNLAAAAKIVTDALVKRGVLVGDSPTYVECVTLGPCIRGSSTYCTYKIVEPCH